MSTRFKRWLLIFLWAWSGTLLATEVTVTRVPLKPLSAMYKIDLRTQAVQFLPFTVVGGEELIITVMSGDNLALELHLPDGTLIDEANAASHNIHFETVHPESWMEQAMISPVDSHLFVIKQPNPGQYELQVDGTNATKLEEIPIRIETMGSPIRTGLVVHKPTVVPGENITFSVLLFEQDQPIIGATVEGKVLDAKNRTEIATLTFADDGQNADRRTNDGSYAALYKAPQQGGGYLIAINIAGTTSTGQAFEATEGGSIRVEPPNIELTGVYQEQAVDADNDGYIDYVRFEFEYTGPRSAETYYVSLFLKAENGEEVEVSSGPIPDLTQPLAVKFPAEDMKKLQMDGPYQISRVEVSTESRLALGIGYWDNLGQTAAYRLADLERRNTLLLPLRSDRGVDVDGDGLFDWLEVVFRVDVLLSGYYGLSADLDDKTGVELDSGHITSIYLARGAHDIPLAFSGEKIGRSGQDGPYIINNVLAYPLVKSERTTSTWVRDEFGSTQSYTCLQFSGCSGDVNTLFQQLFNQLEALNLNQGLKNSLRVKLKGAQAALDKKQKKEVRKNALGKLDAFINELVAQREKTIPPAEADMLIEGAESLSDMLRNQ